MYWLDVNGSKYLYNPTYTAFYFIRKADLNIQ